MTTNERNTIQTNGYNEAVRYMDNAENDLKRAGVADTGKDYKDAKYVRRACGVAYVGLLIALETWLTLKGVDVPTNKKKKLRKSIEFYQNHIGRLDGKLLTTLNSAYRILHLYGYYDGETSIKTIEDGFERAYNIIERIKPAA